MNNESKNQELNDSIGYLRSTKAIRSACKQIFEYVKGGRSEYWRLQERRTPQVADYVYEITKARYPKNNIPLHGRLRHLQAGGVDRVETFRRILGHLSQVEQCRSMVELVIISVLLDAGAGDQWTFDEPMSGKTYSRSEGLAVGAFHLIKKGLLSSGRHPWVVDSEGLKRISTDLLADAFQVSESNPLLGVAGRCSILNRLGDVIANKQHLFETQTAVRLGGIVDFFLKDLVSSNSTFSADLLLKTVLEVFAEIWPDPTIYKNVPIGDVGLHDHVRGEFGTHQMVPFHKLSQWLVYSLIEPLSVGGIQVVEINSLTGLPEYRNGGLFFDLGVIELKDQELIHETYHPSHKLIVEWRALTNELLDQVYELICSKMKIDKGQFTMGHLLQGGTWQAGRNAALQKRPDGSPPLKLNLNGTVF